MLIIYCFVVSFKYKYYKGDTEKFAEDFQRHAGIARKYGYKLSVHSGSDKSAVFPTVARETGGAYHIKTAGTNWLEALRILAEREPNLFREIAVFALGKLPEAKKYYHITENTANIPDIETLAEDALPSLLDQPDSRQVLHVTYGLILLAEHNGKFLFRNRVYSALDKHEQQYYAALSKHIGKHLRLLETMPEA